MKWLEHSRRCLQQTGVTQPLKVDISLFPPPIIAPSSKHLVTWVSTYSFSNTFRLSPNSFVSVISYLPLASIPLTLSLAVMSFLGSYAWILGPATTLPFIMARNVHPSQHNLHPNPKLMLQTLCQAFSPQRCLPLNKTTG